MTQAPGDRGVTGDVERDERLDRLYRESPGPKPPAHLDAAILAAARREAGARPRAIPSALTRWRVPVAVAAVVVLSASLVILVREEGGDSLLQPLPAPPSASRPPQAGSGAVPLPAPSVRQAAPAPAVASIQEAETGAPAASGKPDARPQRDIPSGPPPGAMPGAAPEMAASSHPQPFPEAPPGGEVEGRRSSAGVPQSMDIPARAPAATARRRGSLEDSGLARERTAGGAREEWKQVESGAAAGPAGAGPARSSAEADAMAPGAARARKQSPSAKIEAQARPDEQPVAENGRIALLVKSLDRQPPEKWLAQIRELKRDGATMEAEALLAEFKRRFPRHPLPPGLD